MAEKRNTRTRAPNFTQEDQMLLFDTIKPYTHIIECKQTDTVKQSDKQNAWAKITEVFNANTSNLHRTSDNLISCYRNIKSKMKKHHSQAKMMITDTTKRNAYINAIEENGKDWEDVALTINQPMEICETGFDILAKECKREENKAKKAIMGTGGGPYKTNKTDDPINSFKKFIDPQIDGLFTIYDNDALLMSNFQLSLPEKERIRPIEHEKIIESTPDIAEESIECDKPALPNTPSHSRVEILHHRGKKTKSVNDSFKQLSEAKLELVELQKKCIEVDIAYKKKLLLKADLELLELEKLNKHQEIMREKELLLINLKIKNESSK